MKYRAILTAEIEIEAENIVEAKRLSKDVRVIGDRIGARYPKNNRECVQYSVQTVSQHIKVTKSK